MAKKMAKTATGCRPDQLFGWWLMEPNRWDRYTERLAGMDLVALAHRAADAADGDAEAGLTDGPAENGRMDSGLNSGAQSAAPPKPYPVVNGTAVLLVSGPTTKYQTSFQRVFGGTSTINVIRQLRAAKADPDVKRVMFHFEDAPGGTVAGAYELRDEIREFRKSGKPIAAHVTDLCASAAYLFASATGGRITANETAMVGSIGTRAHFVDSSAKFEKEGIRVIPVAAGAFKAAGLPGTKITEEMIAEGQKQIDKLNNLFVASVSADRKIDEKAIRDLEARMYLADEAVEKKLIDGVRSFEVALSEFSASEPASPAAAKPVGGAVQRSSKMDIAEIRAALGLPETATAEQCMAAMRGFKQRAESAPRPVDPDALADRLDTAVERIDVAVAAGKIATPVAETLKKSCGAAAQNGGTAKPSAFMLCKSPELGGVAPYAFMLDGIASASAAKGDESPKPGGKTPVQTLNPPPPAGSEGKTKEREAMEADADQIVAQALADHGIAATATKQ